MRQCEMEYLCKFINVMTEHPGKTIKLSSDGIEALETDVPPYLIIEGKINVE